MQITAAQLAEMINATVEGNPDAIISAPAKIEEAGPGTITFLANPAYENYLYSTGASAVLVSRDFKAKQAVAATLLRVDDVYGTVGHLLSVYGKEEAALSDRSISAQAYVDDTASIGQDVAVGHFSSVGAGASVGDGTVILDQVFIGPNARIGKNCTFYPGVRILRGCIVGDNCILHANVVVGGDGFGFSPDAATGKYTKVPQVGNVIIHNDVEIGACTTIDRATMGSTVIHSGVKLDNLIQIAHNVEIGENTVIAALAGVAGSAKIGRNCRIGGQVGIAGHCTLADGTQVQAQAGVINSIKEPGAALGGSPHMHYPDYLRSYALFKNLPKIVAELRKKINELSVH
ncbi:UDP-3-O-(3-hydroxymyristoyl)glucosamine N-acyltransferase [Neolewinella agarilytica]|uniref:UDP-3-O-acylglucosamine N-acyltransferase n=1 Tax=Neolewinella agarilytica TaxID=478744 RepID=A0A1H8ZMG2_9BACT|nr:UDP-3-O-(3-hydroxymyristoyl)glucosamine N-acyltransferase [Neolewinella agarilytica]SEP65590.1 UDP-3-O-[3-hydroxymyristoyl] glucosamine N-acyltransferase [Neolewinella agarilytica]